MVILINPSAKLRACLVKSLSVAKDPLKRAIDILIAGGAVTAFAPFIVLVAAIIQLEVRGPVLFQRSRDGLDGQGSTIFKLRSMRRQESGAKVVQAKLNDNQIATIGRIIHMTDIDELPQIISALKAESAY